MANILFFRCFVVLLLGVVTNSATAQSRDEASADLARVREQIRILEKETRKDVARRDQLDRQLQDTETAAAAMRRQLAATRAALAETRATLARLEQEQQATRTALDTQRAALAAQLRFAHVAGDEARLRTALGGGSPAGATRRVTWLSYLAQGRTELLAGIDASLAALLAAETLARDQQRELEALEAERVAQLGDLDGVRQSRARVVAKLNKEVRTQQQQLNQARKQARSLQQLVTRLQKAAAEAARRAAREVGRRPAAGGQGPDLPAGQPLGQPLGKGRWPVEGRLLADFGQPRAGGQLRWNGVLIAAPAGTEVRAMRAGKVVYADWLPGLGLLAVIDHGGGYLSLYGHNQDLTRQVGDRLATGDVLAHVGDTGGQARPALYFEVRRNGRPLNPRQWAK
jgi:septal ring factor EnvC (AmiA/AmiB activator)